MDETLNETGYLRGILEPLLENPSALKVERTVDEKGVLLTVDVAQEDMGRVIGRQGDTARSIRRLLRQFGASREANVAMRVNEPEGSERRLLQHP